MRIELWHYNIKRKTNKLDSQHKKDFNAAELDEICNNAIDIFSETRYSGNNVKKTSFEEVQQLTDNLSSLVIKYPEQPIIAPATVTDGIYEFPLSTSFGFIKPYRHMIRVSGQIKGCTDKIIVNIVQHDDLSVILNDPFRKPSKGPFPRLVGVFGKSSKQGVETSLYVYTNGFEINGLYPEYIKRPNIVSIGGYKDIDGNIKTKVECDLPEDYHTLIIDIACDEVERILQESEGLQISSQRQITNN